MKELHLDLETRSSVDIGKGGVYKYASSPDFEALLFGYAADGGEVNVIDLASGETVPETILRALTDDGVTKWAHNCAFERVALSFWLWRHYPDLFVGYGIDGDPTQRFLDPSAWRCTMSRSSWVATTRVARSSPLSPAVRGAVSSRRIRSRLARCSRSMVQRPVHWCPSFSIGVTEIR